MKNMAEGKNEGGERKWGERGGVIEGETKAQRMSEREGEKENEER